MIVELLKDNYEQAAQKLNNPNYDKQMEGRGQIALLIQSCQNIIGDLEREKLENLRSMELADGFGKTKAKDALFSKVMSAATKSSKVLEIQLAATKAILQHQDKPRRGIDEIEDLFSRIPTDESPEELWGYREFWKKAARDSVKGIDYYLQVLEKEDSSRKKIRLNVLLEKKALDLDEAIRLLYFYSNEDEKKEIEVFGKNNDFPSFKRAHRSMDETQ